MSEIEAGPDTGDRPGSDPSTHLIVRDSRFQRISTDIVYIMDRGTDVQLSLVELGPSPQAVSLLDGDEIGRTQVKLAITYTEVARVVLQPSVAITMAMNIVERALLSDRIEVPAFRAAINELLDRYDSDERSAPEDGDVA